MAAADSGTLKAPKMFVGTRVGRMTAEIALRMTTIDSDQEEAP